MSISGYFVSSPIAPLSFGKGPLLGGIKKSAGNGGPTDLERQLKNEKILVGEFYQEGLD